MLKVENLCKKYGERVILQDISFTVGKNEIVGLLGANGSGKTTSLSIIAGYLPCDSGYVEINGFDIVKEALKAGSSLGYLPENLPLYTDMTVRDYLIYVAELKGLDENSALEEAAIILEDLNLEEVTDRLIANLSKGYKQRVALAQAMLGLPELLILDEPTIGLDPKQVVDLRAILRRLKKHCSILLSSHIMSEIAAVCDRVYLLNEGGLKELEDSSAFSFGTHDRLYLLAEAPRKEMRKLLGAISGMGQITEADAPDGLAAFYIKTRDEASDVRKRIFFEMAKKSWPILEMKLDKLDVESLFAADQGGDKA